MVKSSSCMGCCHIYEVNNAFANRKIHRQIDIPTASRNTNDDDGYIKKDKFYDNDNDTTVQSTAIRRRALTSGIIRLFSSFFSFPLSL